LKNDLAKIEQIISDMLTFLANHLTVTFHYRENVNDDDDADNDSGDLNNDQWYETFNVKAEEKIYDDLCSVMSLKVD